jgi:hypothetical protein
MTRQQEQIANQTYIRRTSANNGLPYRQSQFSQQEADISDDVWPPRTPKSAIRYTPTTAQPVAPQVIRNGNKRYIVHTSSPPPHVRRTTQPQEEEGEPRPGRRRYGVVIFGIGMFAMLALWVVGTMVGSWWNVFQDDIHYGRPRTFQVDAVVQHHHDSSTNPSHFIAVNFRFHVQIIEFPAGDVTQAKIYAGPTLYGDGQDLAVVTLSFRDVNGDGKPDMLIAVANTHIVYINESGQFRPLKPGEQVSPY